MVLTDLWSQRPLYDHSGLLLPHSTYLSLVSTRPLCVRLTGLSKNSPSLSVQTVVILCLTFFGSYASFYVMNWLQPYQLGYVIIIPLSCILKDECHPACPPTVGKEQAGCIQCLQLQVLLWGLLRQMLCIA